MDLFSSNPRFGEPGLRLALFRERYRRWRRMRAEKWESLCTGCGLCCYERDALPLGRIRIRPGSACRFLDPVTQRCTVYDHRFAVCSYCAKVRLFHAILDPTMPPDCGYVRHYRPAWLRGRLLESPRTGAARSRSSELSNT